MLYSTGSNSHGQVGVGDTLDRHSFVQSSLPHAPRAVALGANHSLALLPDGALYSAGSNARGQLGPAAPSTAFARLPLELILGALGDLDRAQLGDLLAWEVEGVAAAWETSFVHLRSTGLGRDALVSMGANDWGEAGAARHGQIGLVSFAHLLSPPSTRYTLSQLTASPRHVLVSLDLPAASLLVGWGAARHGQLGPIATRTVPIPTLIPLPAGSTLLQVALGRDHSALLLRARSSSMSVLLLGSDKHGQATSDSLDATVQHLACTWSGTYRHAAARVILAGGTNSHGQLAAPPSLSRSSITLPSHLTITKLVGGSEHVLALCSSSAGGAEVWGWGWNEHGNLGDGTIEDAWSPVRVCATGWARVGGAVDVWAGNATSWVAVADPSAG